MTNPDQETNQIKVFTYEKFTQDKDLVELSGVQIGDLYPASTEGVATAISALGERYDQLLLEILDGEQNSDELLDFLAGKVVRGDTGELLNGEIPSHLEGAILQTDIHFAGGESRVLFTTIHKAIYRYLDLAQVLGLNRHFGAKYFFWHIAELHFRRFQRDYPGVLSEDEIQRIELRIKAVGERDAMLNAFVNVVLGD